MNKCVYCNAELTKEEVESHENICSRCLSEIRDIIQSRKEN